MVLKNIVEIKKKTLNLINLLEILNECIGYTLIILCIFLIAGAIQLALISVVMRISNVFFPKKT